MKVLKAPVIVGSLSLVVLTHCRVGGTTDIIARVLKGLGGRYSLLSWVELSDPASHSHRRWLGHLSRSRLL